MLKVLKFLVLMFLIGCQKGCQPQSQTLPDGASAPMSPAGPVSLGSVSAGGTCDAALTVEVILGPFVLPLFLRAQTSADARGATTGHVSVDVGGLLTARCAVSPAHPDGMCAVGGLAPRLMGAGLGEEVGHDAPSAP